jgi:hypothetical protein
VNIEPEALAEVYDLWNGNSDSDTAGRIHWSDWAL